MNIDKFVAMTNTLPRLCTEQDHDEYLIVLNDIQFELGELEWKLPVNKQLRDQKLQDRVNELLGLWEENGGEKHLSKAESRARAEMKDDLLKIKEEEWYMNKLKTLVAIGDRTYYHCKRNLERDQKIKSMTDKMDLPF